jgi:catechol 2,3-dioxygenase-like lactoylglutathione lyase family enzyme
VAADGRADRGRGTPDRGLLIKRGLMIADVLHFSFTVSDIERSVDWYTRVLGLRLVHRQRQENDYTPVLVGIPGAVLEVAQFAVPGVPPARSTHMLELVEYVRPLGNDHAESATNSVGCAHLALLVTDIHARHERMLAHGVVFRNPPVAITEGANAGGYACYFHDPDGITLELLQPSRRHLDALGVA